MTYRTIFVHVDDSAACVERLAIAARLARKYPGELRGAYLVSTTALTPFSSALLPDDVVARRLDRTGEAQHAAEASFRAAATQAGVASATWHAPAGDPIEAAVLHARYADLAVIGQPPRGDPDEGFSTEIAKAVLLSCGRPVLFVPSFGTYPKMGERVMIAWKDSRESARAVADALPLLKDAKKVHALAITSDDKDELRDLLADAQVSAFLRRHTIDATVQRVSGGDIDAGELLLSHAADFRADLIVMGAYSRPPLTEFLWGGVTKLMLSAMTAPVLMSH